MTDFLGLAAVSLVVLAACMPSMIWLRATAICANLTFIFYALAAEIPPLVALHVLMLPINALHLCREIGRRRIAQAGAKYLPEG